MQNTIKTFLVYYNGKELSRTLAYTHTEARETIGKLFGVYDGILVAIELGMIGTSDLDIAKLESSRLFNKFIWYKHD